MFEVNTISPELIASAAVPQGLRQTRRPGHSLIVVAGKQAETRFMLRSLLELWDYDVVETSGPADSVRIAEVERPVAVLVDGYLPMAECLAEVEEMKNSRSMSGVPLIVLSGFSRERVGRIARDSGADGLMVKPLDFDALERLLKYFADTGSAKH